MLQRYLVPTKWHLRPQEEMYRYHWTKLNLPDRVNGVHRQLIFPCYGYTLLLRVVCTSFWRWEGRREERKKDQATIHVRVEKTTLLQRMEIMGLGRIYGMGWQLGRMARAEGVGSDRFVDVQMLRCSDAQMFRWADAPMRNCDTP